MKSIQFERYSPAYCEILKDLSIGKSDPRTKSAPWDKRAAAQRDRALKEYRLAHHPAYAEWSKRRSEAFDSFMREAEITNPGLVGRLDASKVANKRLLKWEMANPTPMTWEEYTRLEVEFSAQYTPVDYS